MDGKTTHLTEKSYNYVSLAGITKKNVPRKTSLTSIHSAMSVVFQWRDGGKGLFVPSFYFP